MKKIFEGRLGRKNFIVGVIIFWIFKFIVSIPTYAIFFIQHPLKDSALLGDIEFKTLLANSFSIYTLEGILFNILSLAVIIWSLGVYSRRFHDLGKSGIWAILILIDFIVTSISSDLAIFLAKTKQFNLTALTILQIPNLFSILVGIMILYLLIKKGQVETNKYGEVPSDKISVKNILLNK